jgi:23S rRNA U2552 (ribose-2'-O)-methylase RlmE/FtsJ
MEIFSCNYISQNIFSKPQFSYIYFNDLDDLKNEKYGNFKELDETKNQLDLLDKNMETKRRAAAKYLHEYELVKMLSKKQVISRAYFKLYEMIYHETIINITHLNCFFICEAPGGFIECVTDIRRKKNLKTNYISISKYDSNIVYSNYLDNSNLLYGDITDINVIDKTICDIMVRFPNKLDFITGDGGFDVKIFKAQESITNKLLLCEIYLAFCTQKRGGMFIIKFFDMYCHNTIVLYSLLCSAYSSLKLIKPKCSRNCNSERYLMCYNFKGVSDDLICSLRSIIINYKLNINEKYTILLFPNVQFHFEEIKLFNNMVAFDQIKTIKESIKMVTKDIYFQHLLINLFIEKKSFKINNIVYFKNILSSRIKKCTDFLKVHNININQFFFK